jgi:hypothetical protein
MGDHLWRQALCIDCVKELSAADLSGPLAALQLRIRMASMTTAIAPHHAVTVLGIVRQHPVATYFVAAYLFSWSYWIPLALSGTRVDFGSNATHVPGCLAPLPPRCSSPSPSRGGTVCCGC